MKIISGKQLALDLQVEQSKQAQHLSELIKRKPSLKVILVGDNPASLIYVRNKQKACESVGIDYELLSYPNDTNMETLSNLIKKLNADQSVDGILLQLPLPKGLDSNKLLNLIDPNKDVDGLSIMNAGRLFKGEDGLVACTALGVIELLKSADVKLAGKNVCMVGRSNLVGLPLSRLLLKENATVTIAHSYTQNLASITKNADIVVVAIGSPRFFTRDYFKPGAIVIDVGINKDAEGKLCGDVDFDDVVGVVSLISPVPKGVGPMTISMLINNVLKACRLNHGL